MAKYHGVGVNWGIGSTLNTATGQFQTRDHSYESEVEVIKTGLGDTIEKTWHDIHETATFEYVATGAGPGGAVAVVMPSIGDLLTITDTQYSQIAGSTWLVDGVDTKGSNSSAVRVTCKLSRYPLITS